ncbi:MAG: hypothetical protein ACM3NW_01400 [Syntrophomonadaceae bacterium]
MIAAAAAFDAWHRRDSEGRNLRTGHAEWIWYSRAGRLPRALHFYAFRDWDLEQAPRRARALVFADPEAVLWIGGTRVATLRQRPGDPLAAVDLAPHLHPGRNRVVVEATSPDGIGGILFAVEGEGIAPDAIASGRGWRVSLDAPDAERGNGAPAIVWGRPPQYPWGWPRVPD